MGAIVTADPTPGLRGWLHALVERPLYADDWHGMSLDAIARETGLRRDEVANEHFYQALYRRWKDASFASDAGWVNAKRTIADLMAGSLRSYAPPSPRVLSLGAGLGLIEGHLLDAGWRVELQECQPDSLERFRSDPRTRVWIGPDLRELPAREFDAILSISMVYSLSLSRYRELLTDCARILRPNGALIVWDHDVRITFSALRRRLRGKRQLFWGWLRTPQLHAALGQAAGFRLDRVRFFDASLTAIDPPLRIAGLQGPRGRSLAQELTFRKAL
jgi:hypothetical protein